MSIWAKFAHRILIRWLEVLGLLALTGCTGHLQPPSLPPEYAIEPSVDDLWLEIDSIRNDDWQYLLNDGLSALDWRLTAIDSASTEVWILSAYLVPTMELESAIERAEDRGAAVHILTNSIRSNNHISAHSAYRHHIERLVAHEADLHELRVDASNRATYMLDPVEDKALALHAKVMVIDRRQTFIGSANFDPRSLKLNTEMGLLIDSPGLAEQVRALTAIDFDLRNAWQLRLTDANELQWLSSDEVLNHQPAASFMQHIEDWFFTLLPIEGEM